MKDVRAYSRMLDDLGSTVNLSPWEGAPLLPLHLGKAADYWRGDIYGMPFVLAIMRQGATLPDCTRVHRGVVGASGVPTVIGAPLDARQRHALVAQAIPFISPGLQIHMPFVGIGYAARAGHRPNAHSDDERLSAKAQAAAIVAADREGATSLGDLRRSLGWHASDASRAVSELCDRGIVEKTREGRAVTFSIIGGADRMLSEHLRLFSSPVFRRLLVRRDPAFAELPLAGESALAARTNLVPPPIETRAAARSALRNLPIVEAIEGEYPDEMVLRIEVWKRPPVLVDAEESEIDRISLALSLAHVDDERVARAVDGIFGKDYAWKETIP